MHICSPCAEVTMKNNIPNCSLIQHWREAAISRMSLVTLTKFREKHAGGGREPIMQFAVADSSLTACTVPSMANASGVCAPEFVAISRCGSC